MVTPHHPHEPDMVDAVDYPLEPGDVGGPGPEHHFLGLRGDSADVKPHVLRLRLAAWDVVCTVTLLILLVLLGTETTWPARLFGFLANVCEGDTCGPVPYGVDMYIFPVVWGGIGAAIAAALVGPLVSLLKGWYMSFWPVLSLAIVMVSSVAGSMLTIFSERYWL